MPRTSRLARLFLASLVLAAPVSASTQGSPWPCEGWTVESGTLGFYGPNGSVVAGDVVARTSRTLTDVPSSILDGALELHRFDPQRGRYVLSETLAFPEWRGLRSMDDLCRSGRVLAMQPWPFVSGGSRCDLVEFEPQGWTLSSVPLNGVRLFDGRLTAAAGDTVFAVDTDGGTTIRLNIIEKNSNGQWAVQQTVQAWGARLVYPPEDLVWVSASEGRVVVAASRLQPAEFVAVTFERTPNGQWIHAGLFDRPVGGVYQRLGVVTGLAMDGDRVLLSFQRWPNPVTAWLYERVGLGAWAITHSFDGPDLAPEVALGGGRLALSRSRTTELYERGATGRFDLARRFIGLEQVFHLDDARIAGLTAIGTGVRVVPLAASGTGDVLVCQERGAVVCEPLDPRAPRLHAFFDYTPWPDWRVRLVAGVEQAPPGALAVALRGPDLGWNPAAGGALCIDGRTALRATPALVAPSGRATLAFDVTQETLQSVFQPPLYVQALVVGGGVAQPTNAVRILF